MNAKDIAFGIEFETTLPSSDTTPIGPYHRGWQVGWLPSGWKVEGDSSIRPTGNRKGAEFVSPKLVGAAGLAEVENAIDKINEHGGRVNESCGLHITVTWNGDAAALARLISLVGNHEKALFAATGTKTRERGVDGRCYAKGIKNYGDKDAAKARCDHDRYHALNLTHLARGANRIEFRLFAGTLNKVKVAAYLQMVLGLVELAQNSTRCLDWNYAKTGRTSPWDRKNAGEGETELARLFYRLGWTKGHNKTVQGALYATEDKAAWKAFKAKLVDLARKYDAQV